MLSARRMLYKYPHAYFKHGQSVHMPFLHTSLRPGQILDRTADGYATPTTLLPRSGGSSMWWLRSHVLDSSTGQAEAPSSMDYMKARDTRRLSTAGREVTQPMPCQSTCKGFLTTPTSRRSYTKQKTFYPHVGDFIHSSKKSYEGGRL